MKATDLIHGGYYLLGKHKEIVKFYALNGHFYTLDNRCIGQAYANAESGEVECLIQGSIWMKIAPMPLTGEILERSGFERIHSVLYKWTNPKTRQHIEIQDWQRNEMTNNWCMRVDGKLTIDINHIHKLQMALMLCGLDDLANNLKVVEE